jgi:4-azaleucine resistance transporter AzlC
VVVASGNSAGTGRGAWQSRPMDDVAAPRPVGAPLPGKGAVVGESAPASDVDCAPLDAKVRKDIWVLGAAVGVFGMSFGVLATAAGLSVAQACVMSILVFTGASQFAVIGVLGSGGSLGSALGSALLLAARNAAYGVAMAPTLARRSFGRRLLAAQLVIDESTAMATAQPGRRAREQAFWTTGLAVFVCWNIGTVVGAVAGDAIGDPDAWGLDAAFPAGFVALAVPHLRTRQGRVAAVCGAAIALALIPLAPAGVPIIAAALGVVPAVLFAGKPPADGTEVPSWASEASEP